MLAVDPTSPMARRDFMVRVLGIHLVVGGAEAIRAHINAQNWAHTAANVTRIYEWAREHFADGLPNIEDTQQMIGELARYYAEWCVLVAEKPEWFLSSSDRSWYLLFLSTSIKWTISWVCTLIVEMLKCSPRKWKGADGLERLMLLNSLLMSLYMPISDLPYLGRVIQEPCRELRSDFDEFLEGVIVY